MLAFVNFVLIVKVAIFPQGSITLLMLTVGSAAVLSALLVGYLHRIYQLKTDMDSQFEQGRLAAKVSRVMLKAVLGTATKEETDWALRMLAKIGEHPEDTSPPR